MPNCATSAPARATEKKSSRAAKEAIPAPRTLAEARPLAIAELSKAIELITFGGGDDAGDAMDRTMRIAEEIVQEVREQLDRGQHGASALMHRLYDALALLQCAAAYDKNDGRSRASAQAALVVMDAISLIDLPSPQAGKPSKAVVAEVPMADGGTALPKTAATPIEQQAHAAWHETQFGSANVAHAEPLAYECTYVVDSICLDILKRAEDGAASIEEAHLLRLMQTFALRIQGANNVLMSYLDGNEVTVDQAYRRIYGIAPAKGGAA
ncbi:hypothetical protein [Pseudorhodoferax sp.]|uniref:hypothetical protein n=1 Tax=Pseudorhodoferax sp. TaxID=1993553 RepID=UPI0039E22F09